MAKSDAPGARLAADAKAAKAQLRFDRGRESTIDLAKLVIALATGSVAALFAALLRTPPLPLTATGWKWFAAALVAMVAAVGTALLGWAADAGFYGAWGFKSLASASGDVDQVGRWRERRERWRRARSILWGLAALLFLGGVAATGIVALELRPPNIRTR